MLVCKRSFLRISTPLEFTRRNLRMLVCKRSFLRISTATLSVPPWYDGLSLGVLSKKDSYVSMIPVVVEAYVLNLRVHTLLHDPW